MYKCHIGDYSCFLSVDGDGRTNDFSNHGDLTSSAETKVDFNSTCGSSPANVNDR